MLEKLKIPSRSTLLALLIVIAVSSLFAYTVQERSRWFGKMHVGMWLTGSTLEFSRNWYRDGAFNDGFLMLEKPRSIESPDLRSRSIYMSYPPGCILPIYAISYLTQTEPSLKMVMAYNLFIHLSVSLAFAFIGFLIAKRLALSSLATLVFAILPASYYLLAPLPMAYHQNRYFADMAVMFPFGMVVFLEVLFATHELPKKWFITLSVIQHLFFALGLLTDYLFVFVYALFFFKRLILGELGAKPVVLLKRIAVFSISAVLPIGLFVYQIFHFNMLRAVKDKFLFRTAGDERGARAVTNLLKSKKTGASFYEQFWERHVGGRLGDVGVYIIFISAFLIAALIIYFCIKRFIRKPAMPKLAGQVLGIAAIVLYACILQIYFLSNHSAFHDFSALKMAFVVAIVPFSLLPLALAAMSPKINGYLTGRAAEIRCFYFRGDLYPIPVFLCLLTLLVFSNLADIHAKFIPLIDRSEQREGEIGNFLNKHTGYKDIVFSNTIRVSTNPPRIPSLSMKLVYKIKDLKQIHDQIKKLPNKAVVNFLLDTKGKKTTEPPGGNLFWVSAKRIREGDLTLLKMPKPKFIKAYASSTKQPQAVLNRTPLLRPSTSEPTAAP